MNEHNSTDRKVEWMSFMQRTAALKSDESKMMRSTDDDISRLLTMSRREVKYRVDKAEFDGIREALLSSTRPSRLNGVSTSFRISIYLDTPDRRFSRAALKKAEPSVKYRIRDYYFMEGSFSAPVFSDDCFIELKSRIGQMVKKERVLVSRNSVADILRNTKVPFGTGHHLLVSEPVASEASGIPLEAIFAVHYRRSTLEDAAAGLRVTFDDMITYHALPDTAADPSLFRLPTLPPPILTDPAHVIEVKSIYALPSRAEEILSDVSPSTKSKFGIGVRAIERASHRNETRVLR